MNSTASRGTTSVGCGSPVGKPAVTDMPAFSRPSRSSSRTFTGKVRDGPEPSGVTAKTSPGTSSGAAPSPAASTITSAVLAGA